MAVSIENGWFKVPKVTNELLQQKHNRFLDLKVRVLADQLITFSEKGVNARNLALSDGALKQQVEQAKGTNDNEIREEVDRLLDVAITTISGGFDARISKLYQDLRLVLGTSTWGLDRNLNAYRQEGARAKIVGFFRKDRGSSAEVHQALQGKIIEIQESSVSQNKYVQTDLEVKTIELINLAITMRYIK